MYNSYSRGVRRCVTVTYGMYGDAPWLLRGCKEVRHDSKRCREVRHGYKWGVGWSTMLTKGVSRGVP